MRTALYYEIVGFSWGASRVMASKPDSDEMLCQQAQTGDRMAEESLIVRHTRLVRRCAHPLFLMGGDSEDLIQEGLMGLLSAIRDYKPDKNAAFRTYAEICVRNRLSTAIVVANRRKHVPLNESLSLYSQEIVVTPSGTDDPEQWVIGREERKEFSETLKGLLSTLEADVLSRYLDGFSYREIAEQMNVRSKTVDNAIQRIRWKLARMNGRQKK